MNETEKQIVDEINRRLLSLYEREDFTDTHGGIETRTRIHVLKEVRQLVLKNHFDNQPPVTFSDKNVNAVETPAPATMIYARDILEWCEEQKLSTRGDGFSKIHNDAMGAVQNWVIHKIQKQNEHR